MAQSQTQSGGSNSTGHELHENVAVDLVEYIRSNTIRNEQQFCLLIYSLLTGLLDDPDSYNSVVVIGTSSSGKTHMYKKAKILMQYIDVYETTSGSAKSMIYDDEWDGSDIAMLDELNKPPEDLIEFLKSVHGGDGQMSYKVTQGSMKEGFSTENIEKEAMVYSFLYAQHDADFEMWNRLLKIPVHESESKNRAVGAMAFDHSHINIGNDDVEYGFDFDEGEQALKEQVASVKANATKRVVLPDGSRDFEWDVWEVVKPIFAHGRSEVNRIYQMVANLIRGSALLNYQNRRTITVDGEECLVAAPQDVANILSCRESLLATTHELDDKRRSIAEAITAKSGDMNEVQGMKPILEFLEESDAPTVKESEMDNLLGDLKENYIIDIHEDTGAGGEDIYEFLGWDDLGVANVSQYADQFEDAVAPVSRQPFLDYHADQKERLETHADDLLAKANVEAGSSYGGDTGGGNSGLSDFGGGVDDEPEIELDAVEQLVVDRTETILHNERIEDLSDVPIEALIGLSPLDNPSEIVGDVTGSPLDPDHEVWDQPDKDDTWITDQTDAKRELRRAFESLIELGVITFDEIHETDPSGTPIDATLTVEPPA